MIMLKLIISSVLNESKSATSLCKIDLSKKENLMNKSNIGFGATNEINYLLKKDVVTSGFDLMGRICDSWQGFEFSRLNSSSSWAFSWQGKKIKTIGTTNTSVHLNNMKIILTLVYYVDYVAFCCIGSFLIVRNRAK